MTQDLIFCPSAVVDGSFIKTSMTCSHTGGMEGGAEGAIKVGMLAGALAGGGGGGGGVGASVIGRETDVVSGDTRGRGQAREKVPNFFVIRVRVGMLGR